MSSIPSDIRIDVNPIEPDDATAERQARKALDAEQRQVSGDPPAVIKPIGIGALIDANPELKPVLIDGLLRRGETANIIASSKIGKSFLAGGLAWSVATGDQWLGREVVQGRVLVIDNELHPETLANRLHRIATDRQISIKEHEDEIQVVSLRGTSADVHSLDYRIADIKPGDYALVVIDALYRMLPDGTSENDNAQMMAIYNRLDHYAKLWDCGIAVVHHSSKGQQGDKAITDVGSGAGAISRAADTHIAIRPHEDEDKGLAVLEAVTRSFKSPEPICIRFEYPLWHAMDGVRPVVKKVGQQKEAKQAKDDAEADQKVRQLFERHGSKKLSRSVITDSTGMGPTRVGRALGRGVDNGWLAVRYKRRGRSRVPIYMVIGSPPDATVETKVVQGVDMTTFMTQSRPDIISTTTPEPTPEPTPKERPVE
jgi:hypothetical protein